MPNNLYKVTVKKEGRINGQNLRKDMEINIQSSGNPLYDKSVRNEIAEKMSMLYGVDVDKVGTYSSFLEVEKR